MATMGFSLSEDCARKPSRNGEGVSSDHSRRMRRGVIALMAIAATFQLVGQYGFRAGYWGSATEQWLGFLALVALCASAMYGLERAYGNRQITRMVLVASLLLMTAQAIGAVALTPALGGRFGFTADPSLRTVLEDAAFIVGMALLIWSFYLSIFAAHEARQRAERDALCLANEVAQRQCAEQALRDSHDTIERKVSERTADLEQANALLELEIRERGRIESALRESEANFRALAENAPDGILIGSGQGTHLYANAQTAKLFGCTLEEFYRKSLRDVVHPDEVAVMEDRLRHRIAGESIEGTYETRLVRRDGRTFTAELNVSRTLWRGEPGILVFLRDITERKHAERTIQKQRLRMLASARLSSLGVTASGIAHEVSNPLAAITMAAEQLRQEADKETLDPALAARIAAIVIRNTKRIEKIANGLRNLARQGAGDPFEVAPIGAIVDDCMSLCRARFSTHGVRIEVPDIPSGLAIECRPTQIAQVLLNLLNNAHDAVASLDNKWVRLEVADGPGVVELSVTDSGLGLLPEVRKRAFESFFTTKPVGQGTGLGLSVSRQIVIDHGGRIYFDPEASHTRVVVRLPVRQLEE